jgi:hypothetical protein
MPIPEVIEEANAPDTLRDAPASERPRSGERRRVSTERDPSATLSDAELEPLDTTEDFEPHDTIPAPPWAEESSNAENPAPEPPRAAN